MYDDYRTGMADPSSPADRFFSQGLVNANPQPPPRFTRAPGAPGAYTDDEGPNASEEQQGSSPSAAPSIPGVERA
jgi:hypothetical protein